MAGRVQHLAVEGHAALRDHRLRVAAGGDAGPRDHLGDPVLDRLLRRGCDGGAPRGDGGDDRRPTPARAGAPATPSRGGRVMRSLGGTDDLALATGEPGTAGRRLHGACGTACRLRRRGAGGRSSPSRARRNGLSPPSRGLRGAGRPFSAGRGGRPPGAGPVGASRAVRRLAGDRRHSTVGRLRKGLSPEVRPRSERPRQDGPCDHRRCCRSWEPDSRGRQKERNEKPAMDNAE